MTKQDVPFSRTISGRFALLLAAAAIVPLLGYGAVSMISVRTGAQQAVIQGNLTVARRAAEQIELHVTTSIRILKAVAADLHQTGLQPWQQDRILKNYVLDFPEFTEITLLDDQGRPLATSRIGPPGVAVPGADSITIDGVLMSPFSVDDDLLPTAVLAIPLGGATEYGWLVARLNLEELWRLVDRLRVGIQGFASIVTGSGQLLAHGNPDAKPRVARGDNLGHHPLVAAIYSGPQPADTAWLEYGQGAARLVGVAARIPSLGWTVIVEQPASEAFAIPMQLQRQLAAAIALALLAMLTVGYYWGRRFISPILALTRGTRALAEGRLGERVPVRSNDELGQLARAFNNMADRLVELQEDVRKKERQAMFGRISLGLVHDLSHPIQNLGNACKLMARMFDDLEYRQTFRQTVDRELAHVMRVLTDLRNVAKPAPLERFPLDLNKALAELVESMQPAARAAGVALDTELTFGTLYVEGDLFALARVHRNLITNAIQATPAQGRIVVRTRREDDEAVIEVADTGTGIPAERLDTIFDDFVTTRRQGLGLGLAIAKKIVDQLGGRISVRSTVGVGSTFTIRLPITRARPAQLATG